MKKQSFLLFKNAFKQAFRNKIQLVGLIVLVLLSSTIFSLMQTSLARISDEYSTLVAKSNLHDFVIDLSNTTPKTVSNKISTSPTAVDEKNDFDINNIANDAGNEFIWDRVEGRTMQLDNNSNPRILKILTYNQDARIDKLVISDGYQIGDSNNLDKTPSWKQVVINKEFAQKNNLHINDTIRVQSDQLGSSLKVSGYDLNDAAYSSYNWLKIVGYGVSADFTTPIIDQTTPIPNKTREGLLYVDPMQFGLSKRLEDNNYIWTYDKANEKITISSDNDREIYFVGKSTIGKINDIKLISQSLRNKYINTIDYDAALVYKLGNNKYTFNNRTATLNATIIGFKGLLIGLLLIVLIITGITVILITYKNIDNSRTQIGILKSLGYSNIKILITSLAYPMVAALIGTILVFLPASGLQVIIVQTFANYFNLDFGRFIFDGLGFIYCLILIFGFLSIIAWVISALTVIKKPIDLIKNESATVNSHFSRIIKTKSINRGFLTRFRLSLFTSSIGKMAAASLTMFLGTTLMTTSIIGPKIMADNKRVSYTGMNYQSIVEYNMPSYNSPYTMYKTYNPNNQDKWKNKTITDPDGTSYIRTDRDNPSQYLDEILVNNINSEAYTPMSLSTSAAAAPAELGMSSLTFLYGKMLTKQFLNNLDESNINNAMFAGQLIAPSAWPTVVPIYDILANTNNDTFYNNETYNTLRKFYEDYRVTVAMSINGKVSKTKNNSTNADYWSATEFNNFASSHDPDGKLNLPAYNNKPNDGGISLKEAVNNFQLDGLDNKYPLHIVDEKELLDNDASKLPFAIRNNWINKVTIWFGSLFYGRVGQTVVQGAYSRSPYFIRQNIAKAYNNPDSQFNVSFNVIPFDKNNDELGTYFVGTPNIKFKGHKYPIKVYGLQNQQQLGKPSMMQLYDTGRSALNLLLEQINNDNSISIVINQTIAKQLNLKVDDKFTMNTNGNIMKYKDNKLHKYEEFAPKLVDFSNISDNSIDNNVTLKTQNAKFNDSGFVSSGKDVYSNLGGLTEMLKNVRDGDVVNEHDKKMKPFKVVGIYNGYGQPNAYVSKTSADKLLHYNDMSKSNKDHDNDTRSMLFRIFQQEWQNKGNINGIDFNILKSMKYSDFLNLSANSKLFIAFDNEYPIFNFKFSISQALPDITSSFSTSQIYGDYSAFGLNGGMDNDSGVSYQGYGAGSAINITPQSVHRQLLNQITALVDTVLVAFIIFSLIISFFIILLTSNLVIYENRKTIATMKTLGYSDAKITNIVIGMYLPVIAVMFVIGFPVGWIIVKFILNYLAANTTWVLPLFFVWWLPLVVGLIVFGIYATTFIIDWYAMKKINLIKTLNEID